MNLKLINVKIPILDSELYYDLTINDGQVIALDAHEMKQKADRAFSFNKDDYKQGEEWTWDGKGRILIPGMTDAHMHLDKSHSLLVAQNHSGTLVEAIQSYTQASETFTDENVKGRMRKTALSALAHGTTTIRTHIDFNTKVQEETTFKGVRMALELKQELAPYMEIQVFPMLPYYPYEEYDRKKIEQMLTMGVDGVGGAPHISERPLECIDEIFTYALKHGLPIDLHTDESDDPSVETVLYIAEKAIEARYEGKVVVDHLCSLAAMGHEKATAVIAKMKEAKLGAITLPAANLYLQGRGDRGVVRRGITRVGELLEAGVPIATASDNVCDPFHPFGRGDLLQIAQLTGYTAHMGGKDDLVTLLQMVTTVPSQLVGQTEKGVEVGQKADFVLFDATTLEELFAELPQTRAVYGAGKWLSMMSVNQQSGISKTIHV
ncbi:amidohydrolase family protein [Halalkalibacter alkalisediminis]|uniref:Amidohydrolase family protein n=1 Tax=Halalkalibacter alkalisediminis TaxID=935616 RepID=A0ABV6NF76_9BACI|nr:amidohydrolase family protein [Halalkalibacter alkalisediminis]